MNQFIPGVHILAINLYLVFLQFFKIPLYQKDSHTHFTVLTVVNICPGPNVFLLLQIKINTNVLSLNLEPYEQPIPMLMLKEIEYALWMEMLILFLLKSQFHIFQQEPKNFVCLHKLT